MIKQKNSSEKIPVGLIEDVNEAFNFMNDLKKYQFNKEFSELNFSRGIKNYNSILNRLKNIDLPNPLSFRYTILTIEELKEYLLTIMTKILGSDYQEKINQINKIIVLKNIADPFEAMLEKEYIDGTYIPQQIYLSNKLASIEVVSASHENIHAFLAKYDNQKDFNKSIYNIHYNELISIIIEYIVCYELSKILKDDNLMLKHDVIRTDCNKKQSIKLNSIEKIEKEKEISYIKPFINLYKEYISHISYGYILSDIYATKLFEYYLEEPKKLLSIIRTIIEGQKSIQKLIEFYGLSLKDQETILTYKKKLDRLESKKMDEIK